MARACIYDGGSNNWACAGCPLDRGSLSPQDWTSGALMSFEFRYLIEICLAITIIAPPAEIACAVFDRRIFMPGHSLAPEVDP